MEAKIIDIREQARIGPKGDLITSKIVDYTIGEYGPFTLVFAPAEFTEEKIRVKIEEEKRRIEAIAGIK